MAQESPFTDIAVYVNDVEQIYETDFYIRKETQKLVFYTAPVNGASIKVVYSDFDIAVLNNRQVRGVTSGATALMERAVKRITTDQLNLGFPFPVRLSRLVSVPTEIRGACICPARICNKHQNQPCRRAASIR